MCYSTSVHTKQAAGKPVDLTKSAYLPDIFLSFLFFSHSDPFWQHRSEVGQHKNRGCGREFSAPVPTNSETRSSNGSSSCPRYTPNAAEPFVREGKEMPSQYYRRRCLLSPASVSAFHRTWHIDRWQLQATKFFPFGQQRPTPKQSLPLFRRMLPPILAAMPFCER